MKTWLGVALIVPVFAMVMGLKTHRFGWNCVLTLSCAAIAALTKRGPMMIPMVVALCLSVIGDYFMAHKGARTAWYIAGIAGFLLAHAAFIWYAGQRFQGSPRIWIAGAALLVMLGLYLVKRVLPHVKVTPMRVAVSLYALVSIVSVVAAAGMKGKPLEALFYTLGIMLIAFSDTMIAENDFVRNKDAFVYIMPSYYLCHICVAASAIIGMG